MAICYHKHYGDIDDSKYMVAVVATAVEITALKLPAAQQRAKRSAMQWGKKD